MMRGMLLPAALAFCMNGMAQPLNDGWTTNGVPVTLPHCWNVEDGTDGPTDAKCWNHDSVAGTGYARQKVVYRRELPPSEKARWLRVNAASIHAVVRVDGREVGRHAGAFTAFTVEVPQGGKVVEIEVDNFYDPDVPPICGDFTMYGGLYRGVDLLDAPETFAAPADLPKYEFREDGFYVDGAKTFLKGVCYHQDREGKGWAISAEDEESDIKLIKAMGANAIRTSHYPRSERFYDLCDKYGIYVWTEIPLVDATTASETFRSNALNVAREMVLQHRHHKCIAMWGIFNELYLKKMPDGQAEPLVREVKELIRSLDPRPIVAASNNPKKRELNAIPDALGLNMYPGWYGGESTDLGREIEEWRTANGRSCVAISEYGAGGSLGQAMPSPDYRPRPGGKCHPVDYQLKHHQASWAAIKANPHVWGCFAWVMFDAGSDNRHEGARDGLNDKGLVGFDHKTLKPAYEFYRSEWKSASSACAQDAAKADGKQDCSRGRTVDLTRVSVVVPKNPKAEMRTAVDELKSHLALICGSEFAEKAPFTFVFRRPKDAPPPRPFESRYRIDGNAVWFWGDDGGSDTALDWGDNRGKTSRKRHGTLFAVSLFLENELGIRWLWPGEDGIEYAARKTVALPVRKEASFETKLLKSEIRNYPHYGAGPRYLEASGYTPKPLRDMNRDFENRAHDARAKWLLRHRLQDRAHFKYGHAYTKWKDRFEKTHPEYLNWNRTKGNRGDTGTQWRDRTKLCVSNEAVVDQIIADWLAAGTNEYLNVCENDSAFYCECEGCCALDVRLPDEKEFTHVTDRYCNLWNRIAKKAIAIRPDVKLVSYAYSHYRKAPRRERIEYPENMVFGFVPSLMDDASAEFVRWRERGMRHFFLRPNFHHYLGTIPRGLEKVLFDNFHECLDFGMIGVDYDAPPHRHIMDLEYYVTAKMVADPEGMFEDFCREFYSGFGPAADDVRAYFELVRRHGEAAREEFMRIKFKELRIVDDSELAILQCFGRTEEGLREEFAVVDAVAQKWAGKLPDRYAGRLEGVRLRAEHAILTFRYLTANKKLPQEEFVRRGEELIAYRLAHKDAIPDSWTSIFGTWTGEIRTWKCNAPYRVLQCDGGTLDPRGFKYGWSLNFEGMSYGRWRSGDAYSCITNDTASKGEWSCRLQADRRAETRDDNLPVIPGAKYRLTADLRASAGAAGALIRVYAYPAPEKGFKGKNLVSREFRNLPADTWTTRSVGFVAPMQFPDSRREKYGPDYYENVVPHVQALGGEPGSSVHVDNIRIELLED